MFLRLIKKYCVAILPAIFLILAILIHFNYGNFYMVNVDPEYFHFFNGLNLAIFNLAVDYIAHPGTSLQVIYAISAHITNLIQPGNGIITNALNNPEQFIHGANILLNLFTLSMVLLLGIHVFKYTGNIFLTLTLQLMPFSNHNLLMLSGRMTPETALIFPILLLSFLVVKYLYDNDSQKNTKHYLIGFAIAGGLGIAGKISYLPYLIIPLFLFPSTKLRLKYLLYTGLAIIVFAFPLFINIGKSWEWFGGMFLHSGKWGSGAENFIDTSLIPVRIHKLYQMDRSFFIIIGIAFTQLIFFTSIPYFRKIADLKPFLKVMMGLILSIVLSILLITKHFAVHYFMPTLLFKTFFIYLMAEIFRKLFNSQKQKNIISVFAFAIALILIALQIKPLRSDVQNAHIRADMVNQKAFILEDYNTIDNPLIITSHHSGSPFVESAMVAGFLMSNHLKSTFKDRLMEMYPNTFFYYSWSDYFYCWDKFMDAREFIDGQGPVYIFIGKNLEPNLDIILKRIKNDFPDQEVELHLLHKFDEPKEYFYELRFKEKNLLN